MWLKSNIAFKSVNNLSRTTQSIFKSEFYYLRNDIDIQNKTLLNIVYNDQILQ